MEEGKTKIGMVINTDEHYKSGQHWTMVYCDLIQGKCYFIDSYGVDPDPRITKFMKRVAKFIKNDLGKKPILDYNRTRHQYKNSDCGVYSISFLLRLLKGETFEDISKKQISDDEVNICRNVYFT